MRILHITEAAEYGVLRHIALLTAEQMAGGNDCLVLLFGARISQNIALPCRYISFPLAGTRLGNLPAAIKIIRDTVREFNPQCIHLHAFTAGLAGRIALRNSIYSPHAFGIHYPINAIMRCAVRCVERILAHRTAEYMLVSHSEYDDAVAMHLPQQKLQVHLNSLPQDFASQLLSREDAQKQLAQIIPGVFNANRKVGIVPGRLAPQKNPAVVLDAMQMLGDNAPHVVFCGDGPLMQKLSSRNIGNTHFPGKIPQLWLYLRAFDFAILPSFYEGLSYALLECIAAGLPIITTPANTTDLTLSGKCKIFNPQNPGQLAKLMQI